MLPSGAVRRTPLDNLQAAVAPLLVDTAGRPLSSDPFMGREPGPGTPLAPAEPRGAEPRAWYPSPGYNLAYSPRREFRELTPFQMLRNLADLSDVVRICIEDVKQQVIGYGHEFKVREAVSQAQTAEIDAVRRFWKRPDGVNDFSSWLTRALEDVLVIDALSVYRHRTNGGEPHALRVLDGATIKPIADFRGMTPDPPAVAFQQVISGRVESEFTRPWGTAERRQPDGKPKDELVYAPRHPRSWLPYGQSPVERIVLTVNLMLRRQHLYLAFYTAGNIPEGFWKCPKEWNATQVEAYQKAWDELMTGNPEAMAQLRFMPGGEGTGLENPRGKDSWQYEFEEWLARIVCWNFQVSPLPVAKLMNRATSEQADAGETDSGTKPLQKFIKERIDTEIEEFLGYAGVEFIWKDEKAADERLTFERNVAYVVAGIYTRDEVREAEGKAPLGPDDGFDTGPGTFGAPGSPGAVLAAAPKIPVLKTGWGDAEEAGRRSGAAVVTAMVGGKSGRRGRQVASHAPAVPAPAVEDLARWRKVALKDLQAGRAPRHFESLTIPAGLRTALAEWIRHSITAEDVLWGFRALTRARRPLLAARKRIRLERAIRAEALEHFNDRAVAVAKVAVALFKAQTQRADPPDDQDLDAAMQWEAFSGRMEKPIEDAFLEGETLAQDIAGSDLAFGLTDEQAAEYAQERAAELVGMRRLEDGSLVPNPNAKFAVSETVRNQIRDKIAIALRDGWTEAQLREEIEDGPIWHTRADAIARTEVAVAVNRGAAEVYEEAGVARGTVLDGPGCLQDGHDDGQRGVNGEEWTVAKFQNHPTGHPHCRRDFVPIVEGR